MVHAAAMEPGDAALEFFGKVRSKSVRLEAGGDTAISPHVTETKRREILKRLTRMAKDLQGGELEVGPVKVDGEYAAVIVRKTGGYDPADLRVFSLGLVRRGDVWRAAPVPASFENAAVGYSAELRRRLDILENWMLTEQNDDLERLRDILSDRMRQEIGARISAEQLRTMTVEEMGKTFLAACEARDVPRILGLLGGLSSDLPEDWAERLKVAGNVSSRNFGKIRAWRLMGAVEVLRVMVHHETGDDDGLFTIACMDPERVDAPEGVSRTEFLHLELSRDRDGLWRVDPPPPFFENEPTDGEAGEDGFDQELLDHLPREIRKKHPAAPAASAEEAWLKLRESITNPGGHALLSCMDFPENPAAARNSIRRALSLWWNLNEPGGARYLLPLSFRQDGGEALAVFQAFSARDPERSDLRVLRFVRSNAGWFWQVSDAVKITELTENPDLMEWAKKEMKKWNGEWRDVLLGDTVMLEKIPPGPAPSGGESGELIKAYLDALAANDIGKALGMLAWLGEPDESGRMLRNLGFEISATRQAGRAHEITGVFIGKTWAAVGARMGMESAAECPLYPVVMTGKGPRILLETDLFYARKRGREFLNGAALDRLIEHADDETVKELRGLYQSFVEKVRTEEAAEGGQAGENAPSR